MITNEETGIKEKEDICESKEVIEDVKEERYLGDIISSDGKNIKNKLWLKLCQAQSSV